MKYLKFLLIFLALTVLNLVLKWVGFNILSFNHLAEMSSREHLEIWLHILLYFAVGYLLLFVLSKIGKNNIFQKIYANVQKNLIKYFLIINVIIISLFSDYIYLIYPIIYYYCFKYFFNSFSFVKYCYLDYSNVTKFIITYFILESPFLLFIIFIEIFDRSSEPNSWIVAYLLTSLFIFYLPIFLASWWDNKVLQNNR